jgi:hypothetical protein
MKFIIMFVLILIMPNLILAFFVNSMLEDIYKSNIAPKDKDIDVIYSFTSLIVIVPLVGMLYFLSNDSGGSVYYYLKNATFCSLFLGIPISVIYLHKAEIFK